MAVRPRIAEVTERIARRSAATRRRYLERIREAARRGPHRGMLSCSNLPHGFAACDVHDKQALVGR